MLCQQHTHIPHCLKQHPNWLLANRNKIPVLPGSNLPIKGDRKAHCQPWQDVTGWLNQHDWAVYLHDSNEPHTCVDLDKACCDGIPTDWCKHLFDYLCDHHGHLGYQELSSSGTGYHLLCAGKPRMTDGSCGERKSFGKRLYHPTEQRGKDAGKIEIIAANNLMTYTGHLLPDEAGKGLYEEPLVPVDLVMEYLKQTFPEQYPSPDDLTSGHATARGFSTDSAVPEWRQPPAELTRTDVMELLDYLSPDCDHDQWKQIGMALHDWSGGSTEGRSLWQQWSQGSPHFDSDAKRQIDSAWKSFKRGGITIATVVKLAKDNGWVRKKDTGRAVMTGITKRNNSTGCDQSRQEFPKPTPKTTGSGTGQPYRKSDLKNRGEILGFSDEWEGRAERTPCKPPEDVSGGSKGVIPEPQKITQCMNTDNVSVLPNIQDGIQALVKRYNRLFVHTRIRSKNVIMQLEKDDDYDQMNWLAMTFNDFKEMMVHEPQVPIEAEKKKDGTQKIKYLPPAQVWLSRPNANYVPSSTFYPTRENDGQFPPMHNGKMNLYRGLAVQPIPCSDADPQLKQWLDHLRIVVSKNDDTVYQYLLNWFAHLIQKPDEKPGTAIILKGEQGTGKNTTVDPILKILGVHGLYVEKPGAVSGKHNKILDNRVLVFADEAAIQQKADCSVLRALITQKKNTVEPKNIDSYDQRNFIRLIMATNDDCPVLMDTDERRYVVVEMDKCHKQDTAYFKKMIAATEGDLPAKLLHFLQQRDISQFEPVEIPRTKYLTEAKLNNLKPEQAFVYEALQNGSFQLNGGWPARMDVNTVKGWFREWLENRHIRLQGDTDRNLGKVICNSGVKKSRPRDGYGRKQCYEFSSLDACRKAFVKEVMNGSRIDWDAEDVGENNE